MYSVVGHDISSLVRIFLRNERMYWETTRNVEETIPETPRMYRIAITLSVMSSVALLQLDF